MGVRFSQLITQGANHVTKSKETFVDVNTWKRKEGIRSNRERGGMVRVSGWGGREERLSRSGQAQMRTLRAKCTGAEVFFKYSPCQSDNTSATTTSKNKNNLFVLPEAIQKKVLPL